MNLKETALFLIAMNQTDARIQSNETADRDWYHSLAIIEVEEARTAWREFLRLNEGSTPTPHTIRKIALGIRSRRKAFSRAQLMPPKEQASPRPDPERWAQLVAQGKAQREQHLAGRPRGIDAHDAAV